MRRVELDRPFLQATFDVTQGGSEGQGHVGPGRGPVIGVDAEMNLRPVIGLEPVGTHFL